MKIELPNVAKLVAAGAVQIAPVNPLGLTARGTPRVNRKGALSMTEYTRLRRAKLYAQGLTARGTVRKNRRTNHD